jgi:CheY-like chemotaxis protein
MRKDTQRGDLIILAVSGHEREEDQRRSREAGCDAHLVKPVSLDVLKSLLAPAAWKVARQKSFTPEAKLSE